MVSREQQQNQLVRENGQIVWSNGTVWDAFDFNSLNALFEIVT